MYIYKYVYFVFVWQWLHLCFPSQRPNAGHFHMHTESYISQKELPNILPIFGPQLSRGYSYETVSIRDKVSKKKGWCATAHASKQR